VASSLVEGLLAGYGIAIPLGAVGVLIVSTAMQLGFVRGFAAGAGAATADFVYAVVASAAGVALVALLEPIAPALRVASAIVLLGMAGLGLWRGWRGGDGAEPAAAARHPARTYAAFLGITITNPYTVVYFTALVLGRGSTQTLRLAEHAAFVVGVGAASLSWQTLLAALSALAGRRLSSRFRRAAVLAGNLLVAVLGLRVLWQALG
jgi:threonine/homoserine/homoserine lactone efflux protein